MGNICPPDIRAAALVVFPARHCEEPKATKQSRKLVNVVNGTVLGLSRLPLEGKLSPQATDEVGCAWIFCEALFGAQIVEKSLLLTPFRFPPKI